MSHKAGNYRRTSHRRPKAPSRKNQSPRRRTQHNANVLVAPIRQNRLLQPFHDRHRLLQTINQGLSQNRMLYQFQDWRPFLRSIVRGYARSCTNQLGSLVHQSQQGFLRIHSETRRANAQTDHIQSYLPQKKRPGTTGRTDTRAVSDSTIGRSDTHASDSTTRGYTSATPPPPAKTTGEYSSDTARWERPGHRTRPRNRRTLYQV